MTARNACQRCAPSTDGGLGQLPRDRLQRAGGRPGTCTGSPARTAPAAPRAGPSRRCPNQSTSSPDSLLIRPKSGLNMSRQTSSIAKAGIAYGRIRSGSGRSGAPAAGRVAAPSRTSRPSDERDHHRSRCAKTKFQIRMPRNGPETAGSVNDPGEVAQPDVDLPALGQRARRRRRRTSRRRRRRSSAPVSVSVMQSQPAS